MKIVSLCFLSTPGFTIKSALTLGNEINFTSQYLAVVKNCHYAGGTWLDLKINKYLVCFAQLEGRQEE